MTTTPPSGGAPRCAVVVSTRGRGTKIAPLVESILRNDERDIEVVIVDQSDDDETALAIEPLCADPRLRYVRSDERGLSRGRNLGIAITTAAVVAITDDDCIVPVDWIARMVEPFDRDPRVALVFCNVVPAPAEGPGFTPSVEFAESSTVSSARQGWITASAGFVLGAGMAGRRTAFEELSGFDELLGAGSTFPSCEDNDLMWRSTLRGWSVTRTTATTVVHDGQRTPDEVRDLVRRDCRGAGGAIAKHLRTGHWGVLVVLARVCLRFVAEPVGALLHGRPPRGLKRPLWVFQGLGSGLRTPMDRPTIMYAPGKVLADGGQPAAHHGRDH